MSSKATSDSNKAEEPLDLNPLMDAYNPLPPQSDQPTRFYWQEPWHGTNGDGGTADVQAAFEN